MNVSTSCLQWPHALPIAVYPNGDTIFRILTSQFFLLMGMGKESVDDGAYFVLMSPIENDSQKMTFVGLEWFDLSGNSYDSEKQRWMSLRLEEMPIKALLWLLLEVYTVDIFDKRIDNRGIHYDSRVPQIIPKGSWKALNKFEQEMESIEIKIGTNTAEQRRKIKDQVEIFLKKMLDHDVIYMFDRSNRDAQSTIAKWGLHRKEEGASSPVMLTVYRRLQPDFSVIVAFELMSLDETVFETGTFRSHSIVDAMKQSGKWVEEGSEDQWLDKWVPEPKWLIDTDHFEAYRLLNVPIPIAGPTESLIAWLNQKNQA